MTFQEYQAACKQLAQYPDVGKNFIYRALGLTGEAGEVAEKIKKVWRNDNGVISDTARHEIAKELGDVLWYVSQVATELDLDLHDIAAGNIAKLKDRIDRGVLKSAGDNR